MKVINWIFSPSVSELKSVNNVSAWAIIGLACLSVLLMVIRAIIILKRKPLKQS